VDGMSYYTVCLECGYKLLKAGSGSSIEIICPKCKKKVAIEVKDGKVIIVTNETPDEQKN